MKSGLEKRKGREPESKTSEKVSEKRRSKCETEKTDELRNVSGACSQLGGLPYRKKAVLGHTACATQEDIHTRRSALERYPQSM